VTLDYAPARLDPGPPTLDYASAHLKPVRRTSSFGEVMIALASIGSVYLVLTAGTSSFLWNFGCLLWFAALAAWFARAAFVRRGSNDSSSQPDRPAHWRRVVLTLLALTLIFGFRISTCPHGHRLIIGPIPMQFGEGCRNPPHYRNVIEIIRSL
jgi:hypothetical protein